MGVTDIGAPDRDTNGFRRRRRGTQSAIVGVGVSVGMPVGVVVIVTVGVTVGVAVGTGDWAATGSGATIERSTGSSAVATPSLRNSRRGRTLRLTGFTMSSASRWAF